MPFNSVDLSLPSSAAAPIAHANRNSLTPSPRTQHSPGLGSLSSSSNNRFLKHQNDNDDGISANNGANKMNNHNKLNTDPIAFLNEMSEQLASMRSNRNLTASANFARDSSNLNSDLSNFRNNGGNDKVKIEMFDVKFGVVYRICFGDLIKFFFQLFISYSNELSLWNS